MSTFLLFEFKDKDYEKTFTDVLWISFLLIGLVVSLTFDDKDSKIQQKVSIRYLLFSIFSSIAVCFLVAVAKADEIIKSEFSFYAFTIAGSTFSPFLARKLIKLLPGTVANASNKVVKSTIEEVGNVAKGKIITMLGGEVPKEETEETEEPLKHEEDDNL